MNLKKFTRFAVVTIFIVVIVISFGMRFTFKKIASMISGGVDQLGEIISVTADGVNIADYIKIDENGVQIGGSNVSVSGTGEVNGEMGGSFDQIDVTESGFSQFRYEFDASINRALDIDVTNCGVVIATGDNSSIVVDVLECDDFKYDFSTSSNTLVIRDGKSGGAEKTLNVFGYKLSLGSETRKNRYTGLAMVVYLPEGFDGDIKLSTTNGGVKLGNLKLSEKLDVITSNANVTLSNIEAYELDASTSNGRLELSDISATEIKMNGSDGRVNLENLTAKRIEALTSNASIDFSKLFGEKFTFETTNGDIDGSILGVESLFSITTETDRTSYPKSVENPRAQYRLSAKTSGGDINVRFVD